MSRILALIGLLTGLGAALVACVANEEIVSTGHSGIANIEARLGGRIGVTLVDQAGELVLGHRADERFAMCSTFKLPLAAAILHRQEAGSINLDEMIEFSEADLLSYAPVAKARVAEGQLSIAELAAAIVIMSDNTAANLLLDRTGGPAGFTAFVRRMGNPVTRLDRTEPALNENAIGDARDTTSPAAMSRLVAHLAVGDGLGPASQALLIGWAEESVTGLRRIRAGLPAGWQAGDKTGNCPNAHNDVAVIRPPGGEAWVLAVYVDRPAAEMTMVDEAIAEIGTIAARRINAD
jgi:beta-lactamase class A